MNIFPRILGDNTTLTRHTMLDLFLLLLWFNFNSKRMQVGFSYELWNFIFANP